MAMTDSINGYGSNTTLPMMMAAMMAVMEQQNDGSANGINGNSDNGMAAMEIQWWWQ